jgi:hypothetical protein
MPTDEEIVKARQNFEPEYPSGDEKLFQGSQAEQAQNQRTVTQQKKHNEYFQQEQRQTGKQHPHHSKSVQNESKTDTPNIQVYKPSVPDPHHATPEESE